MSIKLRATRPAYLDEKRTVGQAVKELNASLHPGAAPQPTPPRESASASPAAPALQKRKPAAVVPTTSAAQAPRRDKRSSTRGQRHDVIATGASHVAARRKEKRVAAAPRRKNTTQFNFRLPEQLAAMVRAFAERRGMALNTLAIGALAHFIGGG